jgi:hypothetical protein
MNALPHRIGFGLACAAALAVGVLLRAEQRAESGAGISSTSEEASGTRADPPWRRTPAEEKMMRRRVIAKCDDDSLWKWLMEPTDDTGNYLLAIEEMVDRRGWGAWEHLIAMEAGEKRYHLARHFFSELAERDPWKAYEEWQKHRDDFGDVDWADGGFHPILRAAAAVSAEKVLDILAEMGKEGDDDLGVEVDYPQGFDFLEVMEFLGSDSKRHFLDRRQVLLEWMKQSPGEAAGWYGTFPNRNLIVRSDLKHEMYLAVAGSGLEAEEMKEALLGLGGVSPEFADEGWAHIGFESHGKVDGVLLKSAELMERRDEYLRRVLAQTRLRETMDESWKEIPAAERMKAKEAVEAEWRKELPGAIHDRARERWGKMVETAWGNFP